MIARNCWSKTANVSRLIAALGCALASGVNALGADAQAPIAAVRGAERALTPDFLGFNGNMARDDKPWSDARLVEALARSHAGNFRYPGGTVGNYWDWSLGGIKQSLVREDFGATAHVFGIQQGKGRYTLENFVEGMKAAGGVTPVFMLNMTFDTLEGQLTQLRKAQQLGAPVTRVELGNEFYFGRGAHPRIDDAYPSAEKYAEAASRWAAAIKQAFPGARTAACATGAGDLEEEGKSERRQTWDERLLKVLRGVDALTVHFYMGPGLVAPQSKGESRSAADPAERDRQRAQLRAPDGVARVLSRPYVAWSRKMDRSVLPRDMELWITEFNLRDDVGAVVGTWAHGLAIANFLNVFLGDVRVTLACFHNFYTQPMFTAVHKAPAGAADGARKGKRSAAPEEAEAPPREGGGEAPTPYAFNGPGEAMALFGEAMTGMTRATRLEFSPAPVSPARDDQPAFPTLFGWVFSDPSDPGKGERSLVANLSPETRAIAATALGAPGTPWRQVFGDPAKPVLNDRSLERREGRLADTLTLPPYSITVARSR